MSDFYTLPQRLLNFLYFIYNSSDVESKFACLNLSSNPFALKFLNTKLNSPVNPFSLTSSFLLSQISSIN